MPADFICCECGAAVVDVIADVPPAPPLCATCLHLPGWHQVPELRATLGRGYDKLPPIEPKEGPCRSRS